VFAVSLRVGFCFARLIPFARPILDFASGKRHRLKFEEDEYDNLVFKHLRRA
jgi:hypothetical protein